MAITIQFLSVIVPIRKILAMHVQGSFELAQVIPKSPLNQDNRYDFPIDPFDFNSLLDWPDIPDAHAMVRFRQRWSHRNFRPEGGYFVSGGGTEWYDRHLYCNTFMNPVDADGEITSWRLSGLTPFVETHGERKWQDLCVVATHRGLKYPCDWLQYHIDNNYAWLNGTSPGPLVGGTVHYERWLEEMTDLDSDSDL